MNVTPLMTNMVTQQISPWAAGSTLEAGQYSLILGLPVALPSSGGLAREGHNADHRVFRVLEYATNEVPSTLQAACNMADVAVPVANATRDGRTALVLRSAPGPSLEWAVRRDESQLLAFTICESLAALFQSIHDAQLVFRAVLPSMFSITPEGKVALEEPEALRRPDEPVLSSLFSAPEVMTGADAGQRSDQYSLAGLCHSLITGRLPLARHDFPFARILRPQLPHGVIFALNRALSDRPTDRYESCSAFIKDLKTRAMPKGASPSSVIAGVATELGRLKGTVTPVNQDAFYVGLNAASRQGMLLVADGVSTADVGSGDLASGMVRDAVRSAWEGPVGEVMHSHQGQLPKEWAKTALEAILEDANARIYAYLKQPIFVGSLAPGMHPPGSTAVLSILDADRLTIANVGDSRLYLLRDGAMEQMTVDQDLRTEMIRSGRDPRASESSALGALTHSVGSFFFDQEGSIIQRRLGAVIQQIYLRAGDRILICSDGVPDCLGDDYEQIIATELANGDDPEVIARRLCKLADEALGADNITALVLLAR